MNPTPGSTCPAVTARGREKINKDFSMETPCPSFNFILDLPSSTQPFLLNSAAGRTAWRTGTHPGLQTRTLTPIWPVISCHRQASEGAHAHCESTVLTSSICLVAGAWLQATTLSLLLEQA
ncbi:uncharacterized [Tachysurus ichikawai]